MLKTERLILRRWEDSDAEALFEYEKGPGRGSDRGLARPQERRGKS